MVMQVGKYIIYSSNILGHANFELFMVDTKGLNPPVRVTNTEGTDILPVFSPDGESLHASFGFCCWCNDEN